MGRPKLERTVLQARVNPDTPEKLKQMALELGFQWGADGNTGRLLDTIALMPIEKLKRLIAQSKSSSRIEDAR